MNKHIKRAAYIISKTTLALLSIILLLSFLLIIAVQGVIVWLNTNHGGAWLAAQIETAMKDSPYQVELAGVSLSGLLGLQIGNLQLSTAETPFLRAQNTRLRLNPFHLAVKGLDVSLSSRHISLLSIPKPVKKDTEEETEKPAFHIPNIYFQTIDLLIDVSRLSLSDKVVKGGLELDVNLAQTLTIDDQILSDHGRLTIENLDSETARPYLPLTLTNDITYNANEQLLTLSNINLINDDNHIDANGFYNLDTKDFSIESAGIWENTAALSPDLTAPITFSANITGQIDHFNGDIALDTAYKDIPASLSALLKRDQEIITLSDLSGTSNDITLGGNLTYNLTTKLAAGDITGNFDSLDLVNSLAKQNLGGNGKFHLSAAGDNDQQAAAANVSINNLTYNDIRAKTVTAALNLPNVKDIKSATGQIDIVQADVPQTTITSAQINLEPFERGAKIALTMNAFAKQPFTVKGNAEIEAFKPLNLNIPALTLTAGSGSATLSGTLQNDIPDFKLTSKTLNLAALPYADLSKLPLKINDLSAALSGTMAAPRLNVDYALTSTLPKAPAVTLSGAALYEDNKASASFSAKGEGIKSLTGQAALPLSLSLQPFAFNLAQNAALSGDANGNFDLASITPLFMPEAYQIGGDINLNATIGGAPSAPDLRGTLTWKNGRFLDAVNEIELKSLSADAAFQGKEVILKSFNGTDAAGTGTITANGRIDLANAATPDMTANVRANNIRLLQSDEYNVRLNANMDLITRAGNYFLTGQITPEEIQINIPERFNETIPTLNVVTREKDKKQGPNMMEKLNLDITFDAAQQIFVRGWGLDAELGGNLAITGTAAAPDIQGKLETIRGRYEELGKRFEIDYAILRFQGAVPPSPYLDVKTSTELEDDITGHILIGGRATDPELTFSSTPELPEDEVLSRILFGEDPSNISPYQAVQLAQTLRRFSGKGGGGIDLLGTVRDLTGLDDIRVEGVGTEEATVGAGKYISDDVYLELETGAGENTGAASVQIELTPSVTVESKTGQNGDADVGVFWEWDY